MKLPVSFEEASYFKSEYRGDLIITSGVLYYFPHTRVTAYRFYSDTLGARDVIDKIDNIGTVIPFFDPVMHQYMLVSFIVKSFELLKRVFMPSMNAPMIRKHGLWRKGQTDKDLQQILDRHIADNKRLQSKFEKDSVPLPMRFAVGEMENIKLGLKLTFETKYDNHDFRVNLIHRNKLRRTLVAAGFGIR